MINKNRFRYILIVIAGILILVQILSIDFENFNWRNILGPIAMLLVIISMIISSKESKKNEK